MALFRPPSRLVVFVMCARTGTLQPEWGENTRARGPAVCRLFCADQCRVRGVFYVFVGAAPRASCTSERKSVKSVVQ